jgi:hypothetical protein
LYVPMYIMGSQREYDQLQIAQEGAIIYD